MTPIYDTASLPRIKGITDLTRDIERRPDIALKQEAREIDLVAQTFSQEDLFKFGYVPFVIAELVWDYADTVILAAQALGDPATRPLSRAIRQARRDYERMRSRFIDGELHDREIKNGYIFEDGVKRITDQLLLNIRIDLSREYPDITDESYNLLVAVYQCHILSRALLKYNRRQRSLAARRIGREVGDIMPRCYYTMDRLIPQYFGDKPASPRLNKLIPEYINTLANQMGLIEINTRPQ